MGDTNRANAEAALLAELWCACLASVLEPLTGERPVVAVQPDAVAAQGGLCWEQPFSKPSNARIWVCAPDVLWQELGARILRAAGLEPDPADLESTWVEVIQQTAGALAQAFGAKLGAEVVCETGRKTEAAPPGTILSAYKIVLGGQAFEPLVVAWSPEVLGPESPPVDPVRQATAAPGSSAQVRPSKTFELLLDVELPVSVSFGMAQLPLKDVIKLTTGSIVELNRSVTEPVEVVVNNCVIARGEVVVIDGNYGVRIHQIVSRQERLKTVR